MSNEEEKTRIEQNLQVIREYLIGQFKGFELTEDRSISLDCHKFTVTKPKPLDQYRLKVTWPKLSDGNNAPETNKRLLVTDGVANKMRATSKGEYFTWGNF
jgi:hypothetical protein